jgi:hypothetical protein
MPVSDADREDLFRKFLQWQAREQPREQRR